MILFVLDKFYVYHDNLLSFAWRSLLHSTTTKLIAKSSYTFIQPFYVLHIRSQKRKKTHLAQFKLDQLIKSGILQCKILLFFVLFHLHTSLFITVSLRFVKVQSVYI